MVGFNNEGYDYPILHHLINHYQAYKDLNAVSLTSLIYQKSQEIINMEFSTIADKNKFIPQLDLYKIWHFNNPARACSLKHLEVSMRLPNVEDMPLHHTHHVQNMDEVNMILDYNKNDVYATYEFYKITKGETDNPLYKGENKLELRQFIKKKYHIPCYNYPDVKLGEQLLLTLYCQHTKKSPFEVKKLRSPRPVIKLSECIFDYIEFKTKPFQALKSWMEKQVLTTTKDAFSNLPIDKVKELEPYMDPSLIRFKKQKDGTKEKIVENINLYIQDHPVIYGTGGLHHSVCKKYVADDEHMILDVDVGSLYPSIGIQNKLYPEHLGPDFYKIYDENIVSVRLKEKKKPKKERDQVIMKGFKLAANGAYGKSNDDTSFLYDPKYTMTTTINGQLLLSMLLEEILMKTSSELMQGNTDGLTFYIKRSEHDLCKEICTNWEKKTKLMLEYSYYKLMAIMNVSTYIAVYENGDIKHKNAFEIDKELYKNPSMRIVPIALEQYFINNTPVEETIKNHHDIYDFCLMVRCNKKTDLYAQKITKLGNIAETKLSQTLRYFASKNGSILYKLDRESNRKTSVLARQYITTFNDYYEVDNWENYNIDYDFYINECNKIIYEIEHKNNDAQLSLF